MTMGIRAGSRSDGWGWGILLFPGLLVQGPGLSLSESEGEGD